jgi:hypothetical protein
MNSSKRSVMSGFDVVAAGQGRGLGRVVDDEGGLDQQVFGGFLEQGQLQAAQAVVGAEADLAALQFGEDEVLVVQRRVLQFRVYWRTASRAVMRAKGAPRSIWWPW